MNINRSDMGSALFGGSTFICLVNLLLPPVVAAESAASRATLAELERQVSRLEEEYAARHAALQREMEGRLSALEAEIAALKAGSEESPAAVVGEAPAPFEKPASQPHPVLDVSGDFRLRYEHTTDYAGDPARDRGVLRGRLAASYSVNDRFRIGGRLTTGDPDDPNSTDVTMDEFVDDLTVSLDQAYASYHLGDLEIVGGKFAKPFTSTELVWDGDVNPYGLAARHILYRGRDATFSLTGIYSILDEQIAAADSDMLGAQVTLDLQPVPVWRFGFNVAYFDYTIGSLLAADAGDIRDNNLTAGGTAYDSDFDLLDLLVSVDYSGLASGWPLRVVGDYVHNLGAAVPEDSGWSLDVSLGELGDIGDWRFGYGYAVVETDAVLAAFSHDNTTYATNYREHTVAVDYIPFDDVFLNVTGYLYRRDDFSLAAQSGDNDWVSRLRLNLQFRF